MQAGLTSILSIFNRIALKRVNRHFSVNSEPTEAMPSNFDINSKSFPQGLGN